MATLLAAPAAQGTRMPAIQLDTMLYEKGEGIAYLTFNRPAVYNAVNDATLHDLRTALTDARDDAAIHGVIVTGAGKAFAAGADIGGLATLSAVDGEKQSRFIQETLDLLETLGKPVIAAVNGFALGGGCEVAMACTIRIASEHARFGQPEVKLGLLPGGGGTQRLPALVGKGRALQLILTGGMIDAAEAYRIGLVNEIVPAIDLISRAEAILGEIAANAPLAIRYSLQAADASGPEGYALEASYFGLLAGTEDKKEGTAAFLEKRPAQFRGR